ncbi:MAG TPA: hypothetical protein VK284_02370 [Streptosporangiaceae bacterium]|nr:hypothetical protein [Streptosporangiaceae bacterium]
MQLSDFYQAFAAACFALLGLWLVAAQLRVDVWQNDPARKSRAYVVALSFVLPGMMSVFSLIDQNTSTFWQASFATVAFGGALIMFAVRGFAVPAEPGRTGLRRLTDPDRLGQAAYVTAIVLYLVIGVLALFGGLAELRTEAVLLTILVFLNFNVGWLLLFDVGSPSRVASSGNMG